MGSCSKLDINLRFINFSLILVSSGDDFIKFQTRFVKFQTSFVEFRMELIETCRTCKNFKIKEKDGLIFLVVNNFMSLQFL